MLFELTQDPCPGMNLSLFTVIFQGLGSFVFDVTSTHIENGSAEFILPLNVSDSLMGVCSLRGVIFGGNDVGNSTAIDIQPPSGKLFTYRLVKWSFRDQGRRLVTLYHCKNVVTLSCICSEVSIIPS